MVRGGGFGGGALRAVRRGCAGASAGRRVTRVPRGMDHGARLAATFLLGPVTGNEHCYLLAARGTSS